MGNKETGNSQSGTRFRQVIFLHLIVSIFLSMLLQPAFAAVPATPIMTVYQFSGDASIPYYDADLFARSGKRKVTGVLAQGSWVIPCLMIHNSAAVTDTNGTPYVGFKTVFDADKATASSTTKQLDYLLSREGLMVQNHHCEDDVKHVINAKLLVKRKKEPFFAPKGRGGQASVGVNDYDTIVREFHNSSRCTKANRLLTGRHASLEKAWKAFITENQRKWDPSLLEKAKNLDYVMRTAIYEGHLGRGCNAYGACERNIIALSIRNRAVGQCRKAQGCRKEGDFQGVSSSVSQYNIWDEYLTQTSGLTSCFLRSDLADQSPFKKLQAIYSQSVSDVSTILFGDDKALQSIFIGADATDLKSLRHYYHPPAMGACFPENERVEYITAAVASNNGDHILIANQRIRVDEPVATYDYKFRDFRHAVSGKRDKITISDIFPGFTIDGRKVALKKPSRCTAYGVSGKCRFKQTGRYRKTPFWLSDGKLVEFKCRSKDRGDACDQPEKLTTVKVGGACDIEMMPVVGVR